MGFHIDQVGQNLDEIVSHPNGSGNANENILQPWSGHHAADVDHDEDYYDHLHDTDASNNIALTRNMNKRSDSDDFSNSDCSSDVLEDMDDGNDSIHNNMKDTEEYRISCEAGRITFWVTLLLVFNALLSSLVLGLVLPKKEGADLEHSFDSAVEKLFSHIGQLGARNLQGLASLSSSLTSYSVLVEEIGASEYQLGWPYVTDPQYFINGMYVQSMMNITHIVSTPIVTNDERLLWNLYSKSMNEKLKSSTNGHEEIVTDIYKIDPETGTSVPDHNDTAFPVWQVSPMKTSVGDINFNLRSIPSIGSTLDHTTFYRIGALSPLVPDNQAELNMTQNIAFLADDVKLSETDGPFSLLTIPIFDSFLPINNSGTKKDTRKVVAALSAPLQWKSFFQDVYSTQIDGILVVLEPSCGSDDGKLFTYRINGEMALYEGIGDSHHDFFSSYKKTANVNKLISDYISMNVATIDNITLSDSFCPFTISVYPTAEFQNPLLSKGPAVFTGTVICIWSFVLLLFMVYGGYMIENLQALIGMASHNRLIVNKLFPQEVQERMRQLQEEETNKNVKTDDPLLNIKTVLKEEAKEIDDSPPIADLFASATVMFADVAGFTKWSSNRDPVEVFTLLETMYASFDSVAHRRRVFKVETIGDCYMCVTGLPEVREDHAVAMAVFCHECLRKLPKVLLGLAPKLGEDVLELNLRFGFHSGPVTAGVLRGEKSRFQLFGDTVNFASRMESTGEKGKIQISEFAAEELRKFGKGHWLEEREGGVEAKGKGTLRTFWIKTNAMRSIASGSNASSASVTSESDKDDHNLYFEDEDVHE